MAKIKIINQIKLALTIARLSHELIENHNDFSNSVLIGLQPRGVLFANRIHAYLEKYLAKNIAYGQLDTTFHRDDFRRNDKVLIPQKTNLNFEIEGKNVILIDDVLFTGRSVRAGFDALLDFGRPEKVELLILIERRYSHHFPIKADYLGKSVNTIQSQKIKVEWKEEEEEDGIWLLDEK